MDGNLRILAVCVAGFSLFSFPLFTAQTASPPLFPEHPPTRDADPSVRRTVEIQLPSRLNVDRTARSLFVSYDLASLQKVKVTLGAHLDIGVKEEIRVYPIGDPRPSQPHGVGYSSMKESTVISSDVEFFLKGTSIFNSAHDGIPMPGKQYRIEEDLTLFETDIPRQHIWNPESGESYRILWKKQLMAIK